MKNNEKTPYVKSGHSSKNINLKKITEEYAKYAPLCVKIYF